MAACLEISGFVFFCSLAGRVTDPAKARIAGAKVVAINAGTNVSDEATTNAAREYYLRSLVPGTYRIEVEKPGFKKLIKPDVILHVQDTLDIDFELWKVVRRS